MLRRVNFKAVFRAAAKKGYKGSSFYSFEARAFSQSKNNGDHDIDIPSEKDRSFGRDRQDVEAKEEGTSKVCINEGIVNFVS
jgi:sugar phosphate isomerase/epimerase